VLVRTYAAETASTPVRSTCFNRADRTRMRAAFMPAKIPATLPRPIEVAEKIVELCLPSFQDTGKIYDYRINNCWNFGRRLETSRASRRKSPA